MKIILPLGAVALLTIGGLFAGIVGETSDLKLFSSETKTEIEEDKRNALSSHEQGIPANLSKQVLENSAQLDQLEKKLALLIDVFTQSTFVEEDKQLHIAEPEATEEEVIPDVTLEEPVEDTQYVDHFANYLENEAVEIDDAQQSTTEIEQNFEAVVDERQIAGVYLVDAECKATLCKIELGFDDEVAKEKYSNIGLSIAPWDSQTFFHQSEIDSSHTIYYVAKEGFDLPMPASHDG